MTLPKMGEKKIVATKLLKMEGEKKDAISTTFFIANYMWYEREEEKGGERKC